MKQIIKNPEDLWSRLRDYSAKTGVTPFQTHRKRIDGLPDLRGFTPHLRRIRLNAKQTMTGEPWLLHDLLHILFYDYATVHLGAESWLERERFLENHLASEAFAVLALDYFILSAEGSETLTVDVSQSKWKRFQKLNSKLPSMNSQDFIEVLTHHYLTGDFSILELKKPDAEYSDWLGHEIRYARKQRAYVNMWFADLEGTKFDGESAEIHDSHVWEAVSDLITMLLFEPDREWNAWSSEVATSIREDFNAFAGFDKYKHIRTDYDFRFTELNAAPIEAAIHTLETNEKIDPSTLFLVWQIFSHTEQPLSKVLTSKSVDENQVNPVDWKAITKEALKALSTLSLNHEKSSISAFFLP